MKKMKAYQPDLMENLRELREAEDDRNATLEEHDPELFLLALRKDHLHNKDSRPVYSLRRFFLILTFLLGRIW